MIVVLDTNIWLAERGLRSSLGAVARFYVKRRAARIALPEVVRREVETHLRRSLQEYISILKENHRELLTIFGKLKALVLPDAAAVEARILDVFTDLGVEIFDVPFTFESARSSFIKTIEKMPPSDKSQEFKDGVLWADCLTLLSSDEVCLVSADKAFYQERDYSKGLARTLASELTNASRFSLVPSLTLLVTDLRIDLPITDEMLLSAYFRENNVAIDDLLARNGFALGESRKLSKALYVTENTEIIYVNLTVEFEAQDVREENRMEGALIGHGDGFYHLGSNTFMNFRSSEETLRFQEANGDITERRNHYLRGLGFGHRDVTHTIRHKL